MCGENPGSAKVGVIVNMNTIKNHKGRAGTQSGRRKMELKIARLVRDWIRTPGTLDAVFGPLLSPFEQRNKIRHIMGLKPLTRADIPPGEDWDTPQPRVLMSRIERVNRMLGYSDEEKVAQPPPPPAPEQTTNPSANPTDTTQP